jgi:uncharacterized membrane protein
MKKLAAMALAFAILPFVGCNTSPTGGSGGNDTFKLKGPETATTVKQGEEAKIKLTVDRGKEFKQDVKFEHADQPKGVHVEFEPTTLKAGDKAELTMVVKADKDAALGPATIKVTGKPAEKGAETSVPVKIDVKKAE